MLGTTNPYNQHFKINKKIFGDLRFMTIGAGSTGTCWTGYLNGDFNRPTDFDKPHVDQEWLTIERNNEDATMLVLLQKADAYKNNHNDYLEYYCWPEPGDARYNSNSFLHGLLQAAGLPEPTQISFTGALFPGWNKPVPVGFFFP